MITTKYGPMPANLLIKRDGVVDNDNEYTTTVEYCLLGCSGQAHKTGRPDAQGHFCNLHVHRSAHVRLKRNVTAVGAAASFA